MPTIDKRCLNLKLMTNRHKLTDIANVERAKKGVTYPRGTIYIQVSATHGQIKMLKEDGEIETKYATIIPKDDIYPKYFKLAIERCVGEFTARFQSNINIQMDDFNFFEIDIHDDYETQLEIASLVDAFEEAEEAENELVEQLKDVKKVALAKFMI